MGALFFPVLDDRDASPVGRKVPPIVTRRIRIEFGKFSPPAFHGVESCEHELFAVRTSLRHGAYGRGRPGAAWPAIEVTRQHRLRCSPNDRDPHKLVFRRVTRTQLVENPCAIWTQAGIPWILTLCPGNQGLRVDLTQSLFENPT